METLFLSAKDTLQIPSIVVEVTRVQRLAAPAVLSVHRLTRLRFTAMIPVMAQYVLQIT